MKLYTHNRAPNPRRVAWFLAEKGVDDIETVEVNIFAGEHKAAQYRHKAGLAHVPALELDDGTTLTESLAICRYLESLYPEPNLFGRDPKETAVIEMWTRRCEIYLANPLMLSARLTHPALAALEGSNPEVAAYNQGGGERFLKALNRQLIGRDFIAADRITTADIVAAIGIDFARMARFKPSEDLKEVTRWLGAMRDRPGFAAGA